MPVLGRVFEFICSTLYMSNILLTILILWQRYKIILDFRKKIREIVERREDLTIIGCCWEDNRRGWHLQLYGIDVVVALEVKHWQFASSAYDFFDTFDMKRDLSMMKRRCSPSPMSPSSSDADTLNFSLRPSTEMSSAVAVTVCPKPVGFM